MAKYLYIILMLVMCACSSKPADHPERPGHQQGTGSGTGSDDEQPTQPTMPAVEPSILADDTPRIEGGGFTLRYGTPGVLITQDNNGVFAIRDIAQGGRYASYDTRSMTLRLDGITDIDASYVACEQTRAGTQWHRVVDANNGTQYIIVIPTL